MSVGISVAGTSREQDGPRLLATLVDWLRAGPVGVRLWSADVRDDLLLARLHPATEPLMIRATHGQVAASANCSAGGPGYHRHVADVLHEAGRALDIRWTDVAELSAAVDRDWVTAEHLQWLTEIARVTLERAPEQAGQFLLAMPLDGDRFEHDAMALSGLGPRELAWCLDVAGGDRDAARSFFPWWDDGWCAATVRDAALGIMWTEVRWRPPSDHDDTPALHQADDLLAEAHRLDPTLPLPWAGWHELRQHLATLETIADGAPADLPDRATHDTSPPIGYRRRPVTTSPLPGWRIRVPGEFTYGWEGNRWWAWDGKRQIDLSVFGVADEQRGMPSDDLIRFAMRTAPTGERLDGGPGPAVVVSDQPDVPRAVHGYASARAGELLLVTVTGSEPDDLPWAVETWRSLRGPSATAG